VKHMRYGRVAADLVAGALALAACGNDPTGPGGDSSASPGDTSTSGNGGGDLSGNLALGGATSQESAMQAWIAGFGSANPDVTVSYDPTGSGGGRTGFLEGSFAFAGSDSAMDDEEKAKSKERCGGEQAIHLPLYISPIAVIYNLPEVQDLQLSPATIAKIFNNKITKWNDPAITADNPGKTLPDTAISPVHRSDESGTTDNFTDYMKVTAPADWPHEPDGEWPTQGGQSAQGTSGVVQTVQGGQGTIGYADASKAGQLGKALVKVGDAWVGPTPEGAAAVVDASPKVEGTPEHDYEIELDRKTTAEGAYPVVLVSYEIACLKYDDAAQGELVKAFLGYMASADGQKAAADAAGSAPISSALESNAKAAVEAIATGS
jgi:phosphate transport system substrate-binding protein